MDNTQQKQILSQDRLNEFLQGKGLYASFVNNDTANTYVKKRTIQQMAYAPLHISKLYKLQYLTASGEYKDIPLDFTADEQRELLNGKKINRQTCTSRMCYQIK